MKRAALAILGLLALHELLAQLLVGHAAMAQLLSPDPESVVAMSLVAATILLRLLVLVVLPPAVTAWLARRLAERLALRR